MLNFYHSCPYKLSLGPHSLAQNPRPHSPLQLECASSSLCLGSPSFSPILNSAVTSSRRPALISQPGFSLGSLALLACLRTWPTMTKSGLPYTLEQSTFPKGPPLLTRVLSDSTPASLEILWREIWGWLRVLRDFRRVTLILSFIHWNFK